MTKFYVYNVQLLPVSADVSEVGVSGYKKLFARMRDLNKHHLRNRTVEAYHYKLTADQFFGFDESVSGSGVVYGKFKRYTKTNEVKSLNDKRTVFRNSGRTTTFSRSHDVPFVFDARSHYLAIEGSDVLKPKRIIEALIGFLSEIAAEDFPQHQLHINVLSSSSEIDAILESAVAYKNVNLKLTFQNGHSTQNLMQEMKESRTQNLSLAASGGADGKMTRMPSFLLDMVKAAALVGSLQLGYYINGSSKKQSFDSEEMPLSFVVRRSSNDSDERYYQRVLDNVAEKTSAMEAGLEGGEPQVAGADDKSAMSDSSKE